MRQIMSAQSVQKVHLMRPSFSLVAALLLFTTITVAADQSDSTPRSTAARSAIIRADRARQEAEQAYRKAIADINRKLLADLTVAREAVMRGGGADALAEAQRIQSAIDAANAELAKGEALPVLAHAQGLVVEKAVWSVVNEPGNQRDVTEQVRQYVKNGKLVIPKGHKFPDLHFGKHKQLMITYSYQGQHFTVYASEEQVGAGFTAPIE
jgi:hypothetical protein